MTSKLYQLADKAVSWFERLLSYEMPNKQLPDSKLTLRNCTFKFKCSETWEGLEKTDVATTRKCNACNEYVYFIETDKRLAEAIKLNQCVAIAKEPLKIYVGSLRPLEEYNRIKLKKNYAKAKSNH
jgi:hypothetical protein